MGGWRVRALVTGPDGFMPRRGTVKAGSLVVVLLQTSRLGWGRQEVHTRKQKRSQYLLQSERTGKRCHLRNQSAEGHWYRWRTHQKRRGRGPTG